MTCKIHRLTALLALLLFMVAFVASAKAQEATILGEDQLKVVLPMSFYFEGRSGPTQSRNAAAVRFAEKRNVIVALIDTAGYSSDVREKYEGFLITDSAITLGGKALSTGAYGFGVTKEGQMNVFDIGGNLLFSVPAPKDTALTAPRPLTIKKGADGFRIYRGRNFVALAAK
ncbi:MAG: hypothetical protein U0V70_14555 [Terriglobia bacterium]